MKTIWYVKCDVVSKSGIKPFDSLEGALACARSLIRKYSKVVQDFECVLDGNRKAYRKAVYDFLMKYYTDPDFTFTLSDIPSDNPDDYDEKIPEGMVFGENVDDNSEYEYYSPKEYFDEDEFFSPICKEGIKSFGDGYDGTDLPNFSTNIGFLPGDYGTYIYDEDTLFIEVVSQTVSGGRSNPLLVLSNLCGGKAWRIKGNANNPKMHFNTNLNDYVESDYDLMCNRTIYRHIDLLKSLGYDIEKERHVIVQDYEITSYGKDYFAPTKRFVEYSFKLVGKGAPEKGVKFGKSAYPIIVLRILEDAEKPLLQNEIIERAKTAFNGTTIHRKTIGNSIKELIEFGYKIEHTKEGYILTE